jgi:thioredoxin reductase
MPFGNDKATSLLAADQKFEAAVDKLPVAVIGAGPVGLAAAVRLLSWGLEPIILEAGDSAATSVRGWAHVKMFSPWRYNLDAGCVALLHRYGWSTPNLDDFPTGREFLDQYLQPLQGTPDIARRLRVRARVVGVARSGHGKVLTSGRDNAPFELRIVGERGEERLLASAVIDASGTWLTPNVAGASGLPALGETMAADRVRYGVQDVLGAERHRYAGRSVLVAGSGHSALGTLLDLVRLGEQTSHMEITWVLRRRDFSRSFGGGVADQLPQRGALGTRVKDLLARGRFRVVAPFEIETFERSNDGSLIVRGKTDSGDLAIDVDEIVVATGFHPDFSFLTEARLDLDPALDCPVALASLIDPNFHRCGTVRPHGAAELEQPEAGLFIAGMKSYGRAPTFLVATGYEQVRSIAAWLAGDIAAASRVELALPKTGVCSSDQTLADASCCTPPAIAEQSEPQCCAPPA